MGKVIERTLAMDEIARGAGFGPGPDGKLNLPARTAEETQASADLLAASAARIVAAVELGRDDRLSVTITGPGPVWGYLSIAHALHGRCARLLYASPSGATTIWSHGV